MTASDGKVKVIYQHGDVVIVGPSSHLSIPGIDPADANNKKMVLKYGKVRAVIDKNGPLSGLTIKTPTAVAGVRGTDLFVAYDPGGQATEVQVLRGEVQVQPKVAPELQPTSAPSLPEPTKVVQEPLDVKAGEKAEVKVASAETSKAASEAVSETSSEATSAPPAAPQQLDSKLAKSSLQDLQRVQDDTAVSASSKVSPELAQAEQKASGTILGDIQKSDQKSTSLAQNSTSEDLNQSTIDNLKAQLNKNETTTKEPEKPKEPNPYKDAKKFAVAAGLLSTTSNSGSGGCNMNCPTPGSAQMGYEAGVLWRIPISSRWTFRTGVLLSDRSVSQNQNGFNGPSFTYTVTATGIDVPLMFNFSVTHGFYTDVGIEVFQGLSSSATCTGNGGGYCNPVANTTGINPNLGIGYSFTSMWDAELLYEPGMNIVANAGPNSSGTMGGNSETCF